MNIFARKNIGIELSEAQFDKLCLASLTGCDTVASDFMERLADGDGYVPGAWIKEAF